MSLIIHNCHLEGNALMTNSLVLAKASCHSKKLPPPVPDCRGFWLNLLCAVGIVPWYWFKTLRVPRVLRSGVLTKAAWGKAGNWGLVCATYSLLTSLSHASDPPLLWNRHYFALPTNPGEQFYMFCTLASWLINKTGRAFEQPQEYDDPNATISNILSELRSFVSEILSSPSPQTGFQWWPLRNRCLNDSFGKVDRQTHNWLIGVSFKFILK